MLVSLQLKKNYCRIIILLLVNVSFPFIMSILHIINIGNIYKGEISNQYYSIESPNNRLGPRLCMHSHQFNPVSAMAGDVEVSPTASSIWRRSRRPSPKVAIMCYLSQLHMAEDAPTPIAAEDGGRKLHVAEDGPQHLLQRGGDWWDLPFVTERHVIVIMKSKTSKKKFI